MTAVLSTPKTQGSSNYKVTETNLHIFHYICKNYKVIAFFFSSAKWSNTFVYMFWVSKRKKINIHAYFCISTFWALKIGVFQKLLEEYTNLENVEEQWLDEFVVVL